MGFGPAIIIAVAIVLAGSGIESGLLGMEIHVTIKTPTETTQPAPSAGKQT